MKLVILDRDGVINHDSENYIKSPEEWIPIPGSLAAVGRLNQAGFSIVVASNQSGIGYGLYTLETLQQIHLKMYKALEKYNAHIDKIYFCPHIPDDNCNCRKPKTGLFEQIAKDYHINLSETFFVGDKTKDIEAGKNAGCKCILVRTGYGEQAVAENKNLTNVVIKKDLNEAVDYILEQTK